MAEIINLAGTTSHSFTIGQDGVTTYYGTYVPPIELGRVGDTFIQTKIELEDEQGERTGETEDFGRVYQKMVVDDVETWVIMKNYSFDTPIIKDEETEEDTNNYKISIQPAKAPSTAASSIKDTDFTNNHDNFGVTRFGTDAEVKVSDTDANGVYNNYQTYTFSNPPSIYTTTASYMPDKNIAVTPAQMAANLTVEMKRALKVEGKLNDLDSHLTKTNLVAAINSEYTRATGIETGLQDQINTIKSKSDVADVVQVYDRGSDTSKTDIVHYNTSTLYNNDVIKVLKDETHNNAVSYYRWSTATSTFTYVGSVDSYYTTDEADALFVRKTGNYSETITGVKTFNNNDVKVKSTSVNAGNTSTAGSMKISFIDTSSNNVEMGYVKNELTNDNKIVSTLNASKVVNSSTVNSEITTVVESNGTTYATAPSPAASNATSSNNKIATVEWTNDPTKSTNVVHRTGNETITGTKTMTGATVTVATQTKGDSSNKAASTAFVATGLADKFDKSSAPALTAGVEGQVVTCAEDTSNPGTYKYDWKTVRDITTLGGLDDTAVDNEQDDQSLVFDTNVGASGAWVNKRPMIATISYW